MRALACAGAKVIMTSRDEAAGLAVANSIASSAKFLRVGLFRRPTQAPKCKRSPMITIYCGAYRIRIPTPNAATRGLQHRSVAVGPQTVRMLLGGLIHP